MNTSASPNVDVLSPARCQVGESPLWHATESALYWVDIEGRAIHRVGENGQHQQWPTVERIGCIALHAQGGLLAAMETGLFHVRPEADGTMASELLHASHFPQPSMRFNDGRTDREGRFWVTSMVRDRAANKAAGALLRCDAGGLQPTGIDGLVTGNGLAFSPDGRLMYLSDSHPSVRKVWAFRLSDDGVPSERRLFIDFSRLPSISSSSSSPGRPDGAAVDTEGCYWVCGNDAGLVHRFTPDGQLDRSLSVPAAKPSMCAFGGPRLDRLYVTSIATAAPVPGYDSALAGATFVLNPGCRGLAEAAFGA